jgi:hypothetical protein
VKRGGFVIEVLHGAYMLLTVVYLRYVEDVARAHADSVGMAFEAIDQRTPIEPRADDIRWGAVRGSLG